MLIGTKSYSTSLLLQSVIRFGVFYLFALEVGVDEYKDWPIILAFAGYSVVFGLGVIPYLAVELPRLMGKGDLIRHAVLYKQARKSLLVHWALGMAIAVPLYFIEATYFVALGLIISVLWSAYQLEVKYFRSLEDLKELTISVCTGTSLLLGGALLFTPNTLAELFHIYAFSILCPVIYLKVHGRLKYGKRVASGDVDFGVNRNLPYLFLVLLFSILSTFDRWMPKFFFANEVASEYSIIVFSSMCCFLVLSIFSQALEPQIFISWGKEECLITLKKKLLGYMMKLVVSISLGVVFAYVMLFHTQLNILSILYPFKVEMIFLATNFFLLIPAVVVLPAIKLLGAVNNVNFSIIASVIISGCLCRMLSIEYPSVFVVIASVGIAFLLHSSASLSIFLCTYNKSLIAKNNI